jgi:hypothetical protein
MAWTITGHDLSTFLAQVHQVPVIAHPSWSVLTVRPCHKTDPVSYNECFTPGNCQVSTILTDTDLPGPSLVLKWMEGVSFTGISYTHVPVGPSRCGVSTYQLCTSMVGPWPPQSPSRPDQDLFLLHLSMKWVALPWSIGPSIYIGHR